MISFKVFRKSVDDHLAAIDLCIANGHFVPALTLAYSLIDALAWTQRAATSGRVTRADFLRWCSTYGLALDPKNPTGVELYAARCSVLHSRGSESDLSRDDQAHELWYDWPDGRLLANIGLQSPRAPMVVRYPAFIAQLRVSVDRYFAALAADDTARVQVLERVKKWLLPGQLKNPRP